MCIKPNLGWAPLYLPTKTWLVKNIYICIYLDYFLWLQHFLYILPFTPRSSEWSLSSMLSNQNVFFISPVRATCPDHAVDHLNNNWWRIQIMKLLTVQFSPPSCHSLSLRSKCSPQHRVLKHFLCSTLKLIRHWRWLSSGLQRSAVLLLPWWWRQQVPLKRW
jgi:hypothetical protein